MALDYSKGAYYCRTNCSRLETSARIILNHQDGTDSFGLYLYYLAYEEMAKGIFCLYVKRGWVTQNFVNEVFKQHEKKIFLFEEIFRSFEIINGVGYLGGKKLGEKSLNDFEIEHKSIIKKHREKTKNLVYVGKNSEWKIPLVSISNIKQEEKEIKSKIAHLDIIFEIIDKELDKGMPKVSKFKIKEDKNGNFAVEYKQDKP